MLLLCTVDALSLVFAVVFLKCRSDINMLQVMTDQDDEEPYTDDKGRVRDCDDDNGEKWIRSYVKSISFSQVYLFQWKEYGLCLASQQVGILTHIITNITCMISIIIKILTNQNIKKLHFKS